MRIKITGSLLTLVTVCFVGSACTVNFYPARLHAAAKVDKPHSAASSNLVYGVKLDAEVVLDMHLSMPESSGKSAFSQQYKRPVSLIVQASVNAHISCYYQQSQGNTYRIFPGVFKRETHVTPGYRLEIPDANLFRESATAGGEAESYLCFASSENLESALPRPIRTAGYNPIPYRDFDDLCKLYRNIADGNLVGRVISLNLDY